ncbi:MAG: hypothetical protein QN120_10090 [Armatimonadota bacterium]|nr:hypothetical protein [Armatimonadota bacterium]
MKKLTPAHTDMVVRLMEMADSPQNFEALQYVVFQFDFKDYEQFIIECPPGSIRFNNLLRVAVFCDNLGFLVETEAVDREAVYELFPIPWAKVEPIIMGMRRELDWPDAFDYFERLGHDYVKWWDAKRKRLKPLPPIPPTSGAPKSLTVARTRPPLPARPVVPPRPASPGPSGTAIARPAPAPQVTAGKPTLRVLAKPALKPVKVVKAKPAPKSPARPKPRPGSKSGTPSSRR